MAGGGGELTAALLKKTAENGGEEKDELGLKQKVWIESKKLWIVAAPAIFTRFSTFGVSIISQSFIGHLGPIELAAYSITFTVLLRFSNGILVSTFFNYYSQFFYQQVKSFLQTLKSS
jgi:MATE family multidrug resistance protein